MESHGIPHRIHASKETAKLLIDAGKENWLEKRQDAVTIKGKGEVETYWVNPTARAGSIRSVRSSSDRPEMALKNTGLDDKTQRLVSWNVEVLYALLEKVVANRAATKKQQVSSPLQILQCEDGIRDSTGDQIVIDEMVQVLDLPEFDAKKAAAFEQSPTLDPKVRAQLHDFVAAIANTYRDVPFHNFEHASHVIMSAYKLMKRIISPDDVDQNQDDVALARDVHSRTYGISSDPLMQFTVVFSCLIHDADHTGLTNAELIKMESPTAQKYRNKSVAEQNSVDLAWDILMQDNFKCIRDCIYRNEKELKYFRQLLVNAVMATDIADKELKSLRESRWDSAFKESKGLTAADTNRRATITYEYIIQASDIAHTMQHWHSYQKFNKRLFEERYVAWLNGHAGEKDPSQGWYGGEIWFFDNYIIPLAEKLNKCGVFGVSYHELLTYALENRKEWKLKGHEIVAEMLEYCQQKYGSTRETLSEKSDH